MKLKFNNSTTLSFKKCKPVFVDFNVAKIEDDSELVEVIADLKAELSKAGWNVGISKPSYIDNSTLRSNIHVVSVGGK